MLETTVQADRSLVVRATPDRVWTLLASAPVWGLMSGASCAFDVPASPAAGPGHLIFLVGSAASGLSGSLYEVRDAVPGSMICVQTRSTSPVGARLYTLSHTPGRRGVRITAAVRIRASRADEVGSVIRAREQFDYWLGAMRAVLENQVPWPGPGLPAADLQAHLDRAPPGDVMNVSAEGLIGAPAAVVWQALASAEANRMVAKAVFSGRLPGSLDGAAVELRYSVLRQKDDGLGGIVTSVTELGDQHSLRVRRFGKPYDEGVNTLTPASDGTRLQLTSLWPAPQSPAERERIAAPLAAELQARVGRYKALIEDSADMADEGRLIEAP